MGSIGSEVESRFRSIIVMISGGSWRRLGREDLAGFDVLRVRGPPCWGGSDAMVVSAVHVVQLGSVGGREAAEHK